MYEITIGQAFLLLGIILIVGIIYVAFIHEY